MIKKSFKTVVLSSLSLLVVLSLNTGFTSAKDGKHARYEITKKNGVELLHDSVANVDYTQAFMSDGTPISLESYKEILENSNSNNLPTIEDGNQAIAPADSNIGIQPMSMTSVYFYTETQHWSAVQTPRIASDIVDCRNSAQNCAITANLGITSTESWSANITAQAEKSAIKGSSSFSYTWSTAETSQIGYTLYVAKGKKGHLTFAPIYDFSKGDLVIGYYADIVGYVPVETKNGIWGATPEKFSVGNQHFTYGVWALAIDA
ncbi:hypothetical protein PaecuDRAFT_3495 [Paenibacillus curdlanolyticus YK9]|uniref:Uncharacterized protein n=1 Tax=Paenibacillus curdlanolyticus YK9 TaxID=717606 RepID=E0ICZ3_9BACL|nr:hypothetical protein [Paenibacillus curdlanolyticus]EFM09448.1 hypothetical protein PaecuDRAFT_3495 [Paenibacillus curdlanolyticus YK9]